MRPDDIAAISAISDTVHGEFTEAPEVLAARLAVYSAGCFVLETPDADGGPIGYLIAHPWHRDSPPALGMVLNALPSAPETMCLHDIALLPDARGTGAGGRALELVEELARAEALPDITLTAVNGADTYWERQGFTIEGRDVYGPGTCLMRRAAGPLPA